MTTLNFGLKLTADGSAFVGNVRVAKAEIDKLTGGIEQGAKRAGDAAERMGSTLATAGKTAAGAFAVREVLGYAKALGETADAAATVRSRLGLVAGSVQNTAQVYGELFKIAQQTRVGFTDLADTYSRLARAGDESGISQQRMLVATQALSQAITVSGGSAASANAAMVQLAQGLASGTLRGEELNSILEQTPRVAQAIAQGLGIGIGQLRKFGEEGRLTTEVVIGALERSAPAITAEFAKMTPTIGQALTTLSNSGVNFVGVLDQMTGASANTARGIMGIGTAFDWLARKIQENPDLFSGLAGGAFGGAAGAQFNLQQRRAQQLMDAAEGQARGPEQSDAILGRRAGDAAREQMRRDSARAILDDPRFLSRDQRRKIDVDKAGADFRASISGRGDVPEAEMETARARYLQAIANIEDKYKERKPAGAGAARTAATDARQAQAAEMAAERQALESSERAKIAALESLGRQGLRTDEEIARGRARIQLESITAQEAIAQRAVAAAGKDLSDRARAQADVAKLAEERRAVEQTLANQLDEIAAQRYKAVQDEVRATIEAKTAANVSLAESVRAIEDENRARLISIATGRDEVVVLKELQIERARSLLGAENDRNDIDPQAVERIRLLEQELEALRERARLRDGVAAERGAPARDSALDDLKESIEGFGRSSAKVFADFVAGGKASFVDVREAFKRELIEMIAFQQVIRPAARGFGDLLVSVASAAVGAFTGAPAGAVLEGDSGLASTGDAIRGRRAAGGPVDPFSAYLVGERGPEKLIMGAQGGYVVPNDRAFGGGGRSGTPIQITQYFDFTNSIGVANVVEQAAQRGAAMGAQMAQSQLEQRRRNGEAV